jgi:general secretion pathway protein K
MIKSPRHILSARPPTSEGFIVVVVLWLLGALSALASIYSVYVVNSAAAFAAQDEQLRAEALVSASLELTAYKHLTEKIRPTSGQFSFHFGQAHIAVKFRSETARIDLNAAPKQLLAGLFRALGARPEDADTYGERIVAWRTVQPNDQDSEASAYRMAALGYQPRGAKFPHANELSLVRDIPTSLAERALKFVTVYSGRPQINVLCAPAEVIAALPGMSSDRVNAFLVQRDVSPQDAKSLLPAEAQQFASVEGGKAVRVQTRIVFDNGRQQIAEAVILITEDGERPFAILSWRDDFAGIVADNQQ